MNNYIGKQEKNDFSSLSFQWNVVLSENNHLEMFQIERDFN